MTTGQNVPSSRIVMQEIAPKLADLTNNLLFGDIWERTELSKRENGLTREEIVEVITHLAFYAGWPTAANAIVIAKEVFDESA